MARPTGVRTLAGYTLGERLAQELYGEVYSATQGKQAVTLLVVDPRLAGDEHFAEALGRGTAPLLDAFNHRAVVGTLLVAQDGKHLVVVTEGTAGSTTLADLMARTAARGGKLPARIATAIARAVIDALATAHAAGIVHGALHPRSVLLDREGNVRVTDFAVGHAAMTAAAAGSEALPLKGLAGFLAPELALGDEPSPASDVYAIGAMLFTMLTGDTPPGTLNTSPAIERLVQRALDTDLARRFASAVELQENFIEALEDDRWDSASSTELARHVAEHGGAVESNLDAATEDLLASLGGAVDVVRPGSVAGAGGDTGVGTGAGTGVTSDSRYVPVAALAEAQVVRRSPRPALDSVLSELEESSESSLDGPHTVVDDQDRRGQVGRDPISELIALEAESLPTNIVDPDGSRASDLSEPTPLPPPQPDEPGTLTREGSSARPLPRPEPTPRPSRLVEKTRRKDKVEATPPPQLVDAAPATAAPAPARRVARPASEVAPVEVPRLGRSPLWTWLGVLVLVAGGIALFVALRRQGKELSEGEKAAAAERSRKEQEAADLERRLRAEQADPGSIRITSTPDGAAVWLLLGRTPFDSIHLKTASVWELRVELEGHQTQDVRVGGSGWQGPTEDRKAAIDVTLTPGSNDPPLPAMPAEPPAADKVGLSDGSGTLHAESKPAGAAVWLLVGVTNSMNLSGIEAGQAYELRVTKDGFTPGYVRVTAEEWRRGGDPRLPLSAAPKREVLERSVELAPAPPAKKPR